MFRVCTPCVLHRACLANVLNAVFLPCSCHMYALILDVVHVVCEFIRIVTWGTHFVSDAWCGQVMLATWCAGCMHATQVHVGVGVQRVHAQTPPVCITLCDVRVGCVSALRGCVYTVGCVPGVHAYYVQMWSLCVLCVVNHTLCMCVLLLNQESCWARTTITLPPGP